MYDPTKDVGYNHLRYFWIVEFEDEVISQFNPDTGEEHAWVGDEKLKEAKKLALAPFTYELAVKIPNTYVIPKPNSRPIVLNLENAPENAEPFFFRRNKITQGMGQVNQTRHPTEYHIGYRINGKTFDVCVSEDGQVNIAWLNE